MTGYRVEVRIFVGSDSADKPAADEVLQSVVKHIEHAARDLDPRVALGRLTIEGVEPINAILDQISMAVVSREEYEQADGDPTLLMARLANQFNVGGETEKAIRIAFRGGS